MFVKGIMTSPVVRIGPDTTIHAAVRLMDDCEVRHLPVVADEKLVGIVSDRDLLRATGWLPLRMRAISAGSNDRDRVVSDLMHTGVMTVSPEDSVVTVAIEAVVQGIGCLPVIDDDEVVGIVTEFDLMKAFLDACSAGSHLADLDPTVERYMTRGVRAIDMHGTLGLARSILGELAVRHLPVVSAGRLVGLVSDRDLRRAEGRGRTEDFPIDEVMSTDTISVDPGTRLSVAVHEMVQHKIGSLPVLWDDELIGILTTTDILDHCMNHLREPEGSHWR